MRKESSFQALVSRAGDRKEDRLVAGGSSAGAEPCSPGKPAVRRALCSGSGRFCRDREFKHISN